MSDLCAFAPILPAGAACALAGYLVMRWARVELTALPPWQFGGAPRRPKVHDELAGHVAGSFLVILAALAALNFPVCG